MASNPANMMVTRLALELKHAQAAEHLALRDLKALRRVDSKSRLADGAAAHMEALEGAQAKVNAQREIVKDLSVQLATAKREEPLHDALGRLTAERVKLTEWRHYAVVQNKSTKRFDRELDDNTRALAKTRKQLGLPADGAKDDELISGSYGPTTNGLGYVSVMDLASRKGAPGTSAERALAHHVQKSGRYVTVPPGHERVVVRQRGQIVLDVVVTSERAKAGDAALASGVGWPALGDVLLPPGERGVHPILEPGEGALADDISAAAAPSYNLKGRKAVVWVDTSSLQPMTQSKSALQSELAPMLGLMQRGKALPPLEVHRSTKNAKRYFISDGHHRWAAALQLGIAKLPVVILPTTISPTEVRQFQRMQRGSLTGNVSAVAGQGGAGGDYSERAGYEPGALLRPTQSARDGVPANDRVGAPRVTSPQSVVKRKRAKVRRAAQPVDVEAERDHAAAVQEQLARALRFLNKTTTQR